MATENALNLIPMTKGLYGRSPIVSVSKEGLGSEIALVEKPTTWPALLTAKAPLWLPPGKGSQVSNLTGLPEHSAQFRKVGNQGVDLPVLGKSHDNAVPVDPRGD